MEKLIFMTELERKEITGGESEAAASEVALNDLLCCPHCGSDSGYETAQTIFHTEIKNYDGEVIDVNGKVLNTRQRVKCVDCKKLFAAT